MSESTFCAYMNNYVQWAMHDGTVYRYQDGKSESSVHVITDETNIFDKNTE